MTRPRTMTMPVPFTPGVVVLSRSEWRDLVREANREAQEEHRRERRLLLAERLKARRAAMAAARA